MTVKNLLLFAFILVLSITKAQNQITKETSKDFDEKKAIQEARKKGVPDRVMEEYINGEKFRFESEHGKVHLNEKKTQLVTIAEVNTNRVINQTIQASTCQNSDLSMNNYSNWTGETANNCSPGVLYPFATWNGLGINTNNGTPIQLNNSPCNNTTSFQVIHNMPIGALSTNAATAFANGYDDNCKNPSTGFYDLSCTPSNGTNSIRLSSAYNQYTCAKLRYQITVNSTNAQFTYQFAVVIEDGAHPVGEQPSFLFGIHDILGNLVSGVNANCVEYNIDASGAMNDTSYIKTSVPCSGFDVFYRKWRTVTIDLTSQIGNTIYADFEAIDCPWSGHYAYAYISANCGVLSASIAGFCGGSGTAVMTAPGGFASYQWYGPNNTTPISGATSYSYAASGAANGDVFSVDCITLQGCTTKLNVTVAATNIVASGASTPSCRGGNNGSASVSIVGGTQFNYTWTPSALNTSSISGQPPGIYSVLVHDYSPANCPDTVVVVTIAEIPPVLTFTVAQLCGTQIAPALSAPTNGPWTWYNNTSGTTSIFTSSVTPVLTYTDPVAPADYFIVTYSDPVTGCLDSLRTTFTQVNINFSPLPSVPCKGGSNGNINLSPTGGTNFPQYTWTVNGNDPRTFYGNNSDSANTHLPPLLVDSLPGGTYVVIITPFGNPSCAYTYTVTLVPGALPPPVVETLKGCALTNLSIPSILIGGSTHDWYSGGVSLGTSYPYVTTGVIAGTVYTDTITNAAGCLSVYQATLVLQSFNAILTSPEGIRCHDDSTGKLKATATTEINGPLGTPYTFQWQYPTPYVAPGLITMGTGVPQSSQVNTLHAGTYTVVIKSGNCVATKTYTLTNPALLPDDTLNTFYCPKDSLALMVAEPGHIKYTWLQNGVVVTASQNVNYNNDSIYVLTGDVTPINEYWVMYTINGCRDTARILFTFPSYHALRPDTIVNIFTPNADKRNDNFYPFYSKGWTPYEINKQLEVYEIFIYNRWGKLVFKDIQYERAWDGNDQDGTPQDDGTYYFILKYKSNCASKADIVEKKGFVQLLR